MGARRFWVAAALLAVLLRGRAYAAGLSGRVTFGNQPVPGATVTASKGDRQMTTVTDEQGGFTFGDLEIGAWTIRVEMAAFATLTREVTVRADAPAAAWPLTLKALDELTTVPASSSAPASALAASAAARPATAPTTPRTTPAASAAPGATTTPAPATPAPAEQTADATDGLVINGSVNNGAASPIAQAPAFGNNRRQGRSLYSGGVAFVYGGSTLDSRPFTFGSVSAPSPDYQNVRATATFGGPVKIAQSLTKDPNVFVSFQQSNDHNATTQSGVMPTAAERAGDFSQSVSATGAPVRVVDPSTGLPFPGNVIPSGRISPQALSLLQYYPLPNTTGASGFNFQAPLLLGTNQTLLTSRVTQALGTNDQLVGQFNYQHATTEQTSLFGFTDQSGFSGIDTSVVWRHRVSRSMTARVQGQFTTLTNRMTPYFANRTNVSGDAGIAGNDQSPENWGPPALQFSTIAGLGDALPLQTRTNSGGGGAEVSWTRGHHNVIFGGDTSLASSHSTSPLNPRGTFSFSGALTGSDFADFLLGVPTTSAITFGNADRDFRTVSSDLYLTDDWRFRPSLTLQVGARWEFQTPPTDVSNRMVNLDVAPGFSAVAPVQAGSVGPLTGLAYPDGLMHPDWTGIQPRLSFAWRPITGSSLLVRGGYGIYRNNGIYGAIDSLLSQQSPLSTAFIISNSVANPFTLANGFTPPASSATNTFAVDPNLRVASSQNWQLMVQRDISFLTVTASYLGTRGDRLMQEFLPNTYPAGVATPCPTCPLGFVYLTSGGQSLREAGQWQLRWRLHAGLAASVQYTLSKATDNAAAFTGVSVSGNAIAQDWLDLSAEEGRSNFDQRHQVVAQVQYTTGVGLGGGGLMQGEAGRWLAGWTVTGALTTGSGLPFTPVYLVPVAGTGIVGSLRPSLTGASTDAVSGRYLNPDAYTLPAAGAWGDVPRNSVSGPRPFTFDMSAARTFELTTRVTLDWRIDATNVLNRETFTGVNAVVGSAQFGAPSQANSPRKLVSTMRLRF